MVFLACHYRYSDASYAYSGLQQYWERATGKSIVGTIEPTGFKRVAFPLHKACGMERAHPIVFRKIRFPPCPCLIIPASTWNAFGIKQCLVHTSPDIPDCIILPHYSRSIPADAGNHIEIYISETE